MGIIKRQGLKSSIVNYAGVLIGVLFFNFVFPNLVDAKDLGLINLLRNLMYVFATIPALGLGNKVSVTSAVSLHPLSETTIKRRIEVTVEVPVRGFKVMEVLLALGVPNVPGCPELKLHW